MTVAICFSNHLRKIIFDKSYSDNSFKNDK